MHCFPVAREATLCIDRLAYGGAGFGRIDGKACFVPFTAPGDTVRARICRETASYVNAELVEILDTSPLRAEPRCPVFGQCGGCHWQHLRSCDQVAAKAEIFREALWRLARIDGERLLPLIADDLWGYRSRVQLKVHGRGTSFSVGFYAPGSHFVINLPDSCAVAMPVINNAITELRQVLEEFPERDRIPQIDLAAGDDEAVVMTVHYIGEQPARTVKFWQFRQSCLPSIAGACLQQGRKTTITPLFGVLDLHYDVPCDSVSGETMRLAFSPGAFSQVNYRQNRTLVRTALQWANLSGGERVLDLCCGNGNFSLPFARRAGEVIGFETGEQSVADACRNAAAYGIQNVRFEELDGAAGLRRFAAAGERFDVVVIDPPRSGAAEMAGLIGGVCAGTIIYVSCDPQTLGRDLARLQKDGYRVVRSQVVDMFPQTYHMESITQLERD